MKKGFIPALGTPLNADGTLNEKSYEKLINDMIERGAVGLLSMGSMGIQAHIRQDVFPRVAEIAVKAAKGRVPVFVGAMDCSVARVKDRMAAMEQLDIEAFVLTVPYYSKVTPAQAINFFKQTAKATRHGIVLYDLPGVTQFKFTYDTVKTLFKEIPNLKGIKTADIQLIRKLMLDSEIPEDFVICCSNLDQFDVAYKWGIKNSLDGMLCVTPANTEAMEKALLAGDYTAASKYLDNIIALRDFFAGHDLWPSFSTAMNFLGYEGNFAIDYTAPLNPDYKELIRSELEKIGEPALAD